MSIGGSLLAARRSAQRLNIWPERRRLMALGASVSPKYFTLFLGNPRSGTTLIRSLLDANPEITISQELNLVELFAHGERSWDYMCGAILDNAARFGANPVWNGYPYEVSYEHGTASEILVIGDKKASRTSAIIGEQPELIARLLKWSPLPIRFIHCVRAPLDVIATKTRKNGKGLTRNIDIYFERESISMQAEHQLQKEQFHRIHLEDMISAPQDSLKALLAFLGVDGSSKYIEACAARVFGSPRRSRDAVEWTEAQNEAVQAGISKIEYLHRYQEIRT
ncbi:sulfotransferase [Parasphingorhabdus sp.]|uniref:sulfotransferase family protein n=1 Tax=Parasphingorhabdus sp. TaxID=2709688 RepID=UPI0032EED63D